MMQQEVSTRIQRHNAFAALRRLASTASPGEVVEYCALCSLPLAAVHRHLVERSSRRVVCACDGCALTFSGVERGRYQLIPRDVRTLPHFRMTEVQWNALALPISLAFFTHDTSEGRIVARYPSPAGVTESLLSLDAWDMLVAENPILKQMEPDVEALLVNRLAEDPGYFLTPIDVCYELVGRIRMNWRGLSGGNVVWEEVSTFFDGLRQRSRPAREDHYA